MVFVCVQVRLSNTLRNCLFVCLSVCFAVGQLSLTGLRSWSEVGNSQSVEIAVSVIKCTSSTIETLCSTRHSGEAQTSGVVCRRTS